MPLFFICHCPTSLHHLQAFLYHRLARSITALCREYSTTNFSSLFVPCFVTGNLLPVYFQWYHLSRGLRDGVVRWRIIRLCTCSLHRFDTLPNPTLDCPPPTLPCRARLHHRQASSTTKRANACRGNDGTNSSYLAWMGGRWMGGRRSVMVVRTSINNGKRVEAIQLTV
jgi:hypothetical protein